MFLSPITSSLRHVYACTDHRERGTVEDPYPTFRLVVVLSDPCHLISSFLLLLLHLRTLNTHFVYDITKTVIDQHRNFKFSCFMIIFSFSIPAELGKTMVLQTGLDCNWVSVLCLLDFCCGTHQF